MAPTLFQKVGFGPHTFGLEVIKKMKLGKKSAKISILSSYMHTENSYIYMRSHTIVIKAEIIHSIV